MNFYLNDQQGLGIISSSVNKQLLKHSYDTKKNIHDFDPFKLTSSETFKSKIFSMEIANETDLVLMGNEKNLTLNRIQEDKFEKVWQKRPNPNRKIVPDHLKVALDE